MSAIPLHNVAVQRTAAGELRLIPKTQEDVAAIDELMGLLGDKNGRMLANITVAPTSERLHQQAEDTHRAADRLRFAAKDAERAGRGSLPSVRKMRADAQQLFKNANDLRLDMADADRWTGAQAQEMAKGDRQREPELFKTDFDSGRENAVLADIAAGDDRRFVVTKRAHPLGLGSRDELPIYDMYVVQLGTPVRAWNLSMIDLEFDSSKPPTLQAVMKGLETAKAHPIEHMAALETGPYPEGTEHMQHVADHMARKHGRGSVVLDRANKRGISR